MSNKNILTMLILCTIFASSVGFASAENPPNEPMGLYGDVIIGGSPAPVNTKIDGKVGNSIVATTYVKTPGKYGDSKNTLGIFAPKEGDNVDIYVNDAKVTTVTYKKGDPKQVNLDVPAASVSSGGGSSGGGSSGGGVGGGVIKPTATVSNPSVSTTESASEIKETNIIPEKNTEKPAGKSGAAFYAVLGVIAVLLLIGGILKARGKL